MPGELAPLNVAADVLPQLEIALHNPIDDSVHLVLDLSGCLADDLPLERPLNPFTIHQALDPADANGLLEEPHTPALHVAEQHVEPGQSRLEVPQHLLVEQRELLIDVLDGLDVLSQELQTLERGVLVFRGQPEPDVERIEQ